MPLITMKMEMTEENLKSIQSSLSLLEKKHAVTFLVPPLHDQPDEIIVWIRGTIDGVYKARTALTVLDSPSHSHSNPFSFISHFDCP